MCFTVGLTHIGLHAQDYNFEALRERVATLQRVNIEDEVVLNKWVEAQQNNGSWQDLSYGKLKVMSSIADNHIYRLWHLAAACSDSNHNKYNNQLYKEAIKKGLQFWYNSNTVDPNWWFNKIYYPRYLGELLIFMKKFNDFIPKHQTEGLSEQGLIALFKPTKIDDLTSYGTGANAIDMGLHYIYRGLLTEAPPLLEATKTKLEAVLTDNIKADLMYQDHGPQIMIGSYGWAFCDGLTRLAAFLSGSPAAFNIESENFKTVLNFVKHTQIPSIRGSLWDFNTVGRGISRENDRNKDMAYLTRLADYIDPNNAGTYQNAFLRFTKAKLANYKVAEFNKHYWVSDFTQHVRKNYTVSVRNTSTRTAECETGNGENLKAAHLSYGATFISVDGSEYAEIMPVWDWAMIPGTTFPYKDASSSPKKWGQNLGQTSFVGGVSNGQHGASTLHLNNNGTTAKKSWFFFNNEMVCLGTGIASGSNINIRTTINQTWLKQPVYVYEIGEGQEKAETVSPKTYAKSRLKYIRNGNTAYFFPNESEIKYTLKPQSGSWYAINNLEGSKTVNLGLVFALWVDHGINPTNGQYSYIVVPNIKSEEEAQDYHNKAIEIIENSSTLQAVYNRDLNVLQAIFHQAGEVAFNNLKINVDKPCALMVENENSITVSDPSQSLSEITLTFSKANKTIPKHIKLPTEDGLKGSSVMFKTEN
ncbi:MAG: polysaccharide lyase family 8 super-sandwich domain-containing protein [Flavobacteriaceae bacterium]